MKYSKENDIDSFKYIFNSKYCSFVKKQIKGKYYVKNGTDGVIDTIRNLFENRLHRCRLFRFRLSRMIPLKVRNSHFSQTILLF